MSPELDAVVVGGGVVGLAAGAALAASGRRVVLLERHARLAQESSSRNSQVIHAGLYYPPGSEKARLCVAGRELVYERCARLGIGHRQLGKLVVATTQEEVTGLESLLAQGRENGAPGLELLDAGAVARREPQVRAIAALLSPRTGIVDADALCLSFAAELEAGGGTILPRAEVVGLEPAPVGYRVAVRGPGGEAEEVTCAAVVNAAGLEADRIAALAGLDVDALGYRIHPCKGDYFALAPGAGLRVRGLVYPVHRGAGLGIHVTPDLGGRIRLGPDATYVERIDYRVDPAKAVRFAEAVGRFLPGLRAEWLAPDGAGVRAKLAAPGEAFRDFVVREESGRGRPGLVNVIGIESPGLTASPALGHRVVELLAGL